MNREIHPQLFEKLTNYPESLVALYLDLREFILSTYPDSNELLYHTHALTCVYTPTLKMGDGFCHTPLYSSHFNLGFNKGTLLEDPYGLLKGTGKLIRHIPIERAADFDNERVKNLVTSALQLALEDANPSDIVKGRTVSKYR